MGYNCTDKRQETHIGVEAISSFPMQTRLGWLADWFVDLAPLSAQRSGLTRHDLAAEYTTISMQRLISTCVSVLHLQNSQYYRTGFITFPPCWKTLPFFGQILCFYEGLSSVVNFLHVHNDDALAKTSRNPYFQTGSTGSLAGVIHVTSTKPVPIPKTKTSSSTKHITKTNSKPVFNGKKSYI